MSGAAPTRAPARPKQYIVLFRAELGVAEQRVGTFTAIGELQAMLQAGRLLARDGYGAVEMRAVPCGGIQV